MKLLKNKKQARVRFRRTLILLMCVLQGCIVQGANTQMGTSCGSHYSFLPNGEKDDCISLQDVPFCTWDGWDANAKPTGAATNKKEVTEESATVYVQAETAPYLYCWYMVGNVAEQPLGTWPGTQMTEIEVIQNVTFWKMPIMIPNDIPSFNIIFNNGMGGQTEDILGLSSNRYYTYDGYSGYTDISEQFEKVPNAEISQVEIRGDFNGYMEKGDGNVYTMQIDLGDKAFDQQFKLVVNGSVYGGIESVIKIDAPEGWIDVYGAGTIEEPGYIILRHSITD